MSNKNSLKECIFVIFVNSALKIQCHVVKNPTDCFFGDFAPTPKYGDFRITVRIRIFYIFGVMNIFEIYKIHCNTL